MGRASTEHGLAALVHAHAVPQGHYDELFDEHGALRPAWQRFSAHAGSLSAEQLTRAQLRADRQLQDNGVTYNVYAPASSQPRPWTLDVLPFLVRGEEWRTLADSLRQRARLLNAVAADLYGPRQLLRERLLPASLVLQHPGFLRACDAVQPPAGVFLHLVAFDLARGPDGEWIVLDTKTQAPSGAGYALENRATISRLFPDAFRAVGVHALSGFFHGLGQTLLEHAPSDAGDAPHVVLLTPGPYNETYFEHAYLARQLGFPLVEGGDLAVRHDRVFLKTVDGLRPVHAILRRLDDDYCDPLELRPDSTLGVPGLVGAWRAGHVLVANAFGTGVLESPRLSAALPAICERLLNEPLTSNGARPGEPSALSYAPVWEARAVAGRALVLRVFLAADGAGGYHVMPGGLARIAGEDGETVSGQRGGGSKDTWILADADTDADAGHQDPRLAIRELGREDGATPSRAAEHLFWLGRYAERSENCARLLRAVLQRVTDTDVFPRRLRPVVLATCLDQGLMAPETPLDARALSDLGIGVIERALVDGLRDRHSHQSLAFNVQQTARVAGTTRDRLSSDNSRLLHRLQDQVTANAGVPIGLDEALEILDQAIITLVAVGGLEMAHMPRDHGWRFLSIGRHLERLSFVASTLDDVGRTSVRAEPLLLEWLLDLSDSLVSYRARYARHPEWPHVVEMLLLDPSNPRSAVFQLAKLAKHVALLPGAPESDLADLVADLHQLRSAATTANGRQGELFARDGVSRVVERSQRIAAQLSEALTLRYFSHVYDIARPTV
jgi:uncharacterized circularly permuted ATP-grasp superfamily protein/uncharacterized alpha-E superfamily protein